jgi:hypothetical protein
MIPLNPIFFARTAPGVLWTDIFAFTPAISVPIGADPGIASVRQIVFGFPIGGTHLRVTMAAPLGLDGVSGGFKPTKVAVGKLITGAYTQPSTQAVPVEITFNGGGHGFNLVTGEDIMSDEIAFTFAPSDKLVMVVDDSASGNYCAGANGVPSAELWVKGGASTTQATVTGFTKYNGPSMLNPAPAANMAAFFRIGAR